MRKKEIQTASIEKLIKDYRLPSVDKDVMLVETLKSMPELTTARQFSLCIFVGLCTSGVASLIINGWKRIITNNQAFIITDESVVDSITFSEDFDGVGMFISYNMLQDILNDVKNLSTLFLLSHNHPIFNVEDRNKTEIILLFRFILSKVTGEQNRNTKEIVRLTFLSIIYTLTPIIDSMFERQLPGDKRSRAERIFVRFLKLIEQNYREHRQVAWYAAQMDLSPRYLSDAVTSVSRRSPNKWIDKFVCTEIRNLLRHTDKSLGELARELNFSSQSFFGRYFKANVGVSPSEYREGVEA